MKNMTNTEKCAKCEKHTIGPGIWREKVKNVKYQNYPMQYLDFGEKTEKREKEDTNII